MLYGPALRESSGSDFGISEVRRGREDVLGASPMVARGCKSRKGIEMSEGGLQTRAGWIGWLVVGTLLTLVVALLWLLTESSTAVVLLLGILLGVGIASMVAVNEALVGSLIQQLQVAGKSVIDTLGMRKYMRAILAIWILGLFTVVVIMTALNQIDVSKFNVIMGVLGGFVASVVAYYFATSGAAEPEET
jgi:hypothetical protein